MFSPDPSLPSWPAPRWVELSETAALARVLEQIRASEERAVGLSLLVEGAGPPSLEDRRRGSLAWVALSRARTRDEATEPNVFLMQPERVDLDVLRDALSLEGAPYVVMHDAHVVSSRLSPPDKVWVPARFGCTRIAATLLSEGTRRHRDLPSLEEAVAKLLGRRFERAALDSADPRHPDTTARLATHADALLPLMGALAPRLRRKNLAALQRLECELLSPVIEMERAGFGVDGAAFERIAQGWRSERETTTDPDRIARLDKLLSTYAHWPRDYVRADRIHALLHPLATDSGRFSCTDPNLQQVPSEHTAPGLRSCFRPAPGQRLVIADYAQIELRVAAHLAPCDALRAVFREGRDPHRATAATLTGKPENDVTDHERQLAKAVNFGFLFGMGAARFASYAADSYGVQLDERQAKQAREAFLTTYPGIAAWHRRVGRLGRRHGSITVRTALGRRKRFAADRFSFNAALNIPVQGTAAEGFKRAMILLAPRLAALGGRGVLCVHDEYLAEVPEHVGEHAIEVVRTAMVEAMASVVPSVPIEVDAKLADSWSDK